MLTTVELFDLSHTVVGDFLQKCPFPWNVLDRIGAWIAAVGETLPTAEYDRCGERIWIAKSARVAANAVISGPCIIGHETEVRTGAFLRGNVLVGDFAVIGNSTEVKNAVLFDKVQVPHFNYVGDSILGFAAHFGAGAVTSNVKCDKSPVSIRCGAESSPTGRKKVGAMVGDRAEVGCHTVLCPGCVLGRDSIIYPLSAVRGTVPPRHIYKSAEKIVPRRDFAQNNG
jgi:NDP-sugar pyrophosphorylase family protein